MKWYVQIATKHKYSFCGLTTSLYPRATSFPVVWCGRGRAYARAICIWTVFAEWNPPGISGRGCEEGVRVTCGWDIWCIICMYAAVFYISGMNAGWCMITANVRPRAERANTERGVYILYVYRFIHLCTHDGCIAVRGSSVWEGLSQTKIMIAWMQHSL